jgi:phosphoribosyl 1,2-cyclic phosphodiesterase
MRLTLWGTRGSLASPGPETVRYGGNTACVEVRGDDGTLIILDAGSGIRRLADRVGSAQRIDILLTHLHMDHIQGLGFFAPLFQTDVEVHVWGPTGRLDLAARLGRYLSPPLFPVRVRDLRSVVFHDAPDQPVHLGGLSIVAAPVIHPGATVGYRISEGRRSLAYIPDHEPALGVSRFPMAARWTSGAGLARGAEILVHDAQYTPDEYRVRVGWGHSTLGHAVALARMVRARMLVPFHHDPSHGDDALDKTFGDIETAEPRLVPGVEGLELVV